MLLSILQCTERSPTTQNYLAQNVSSDDSEKPCCRFCLGILRRLCLRAQTRWEMHQNVALCACMCVSEWVMAAS